VNVLKTDQFVEQGAERTRPEDFVAELPDIPGKDSPGGGRTRIESDSLGSMEIPADAYWGIHTARALENFPITRRPISVYRDLIRALARVKQAAARANKEIGVLDADKADLIDRICEEIVGGALHDQFAVGVIQGGAGTSTNMNTNEVIANRGLEILGYEFGDYSHFHPIDDVNRSQEAGRAQA
jgi:aspartate ammonia-lyase